MSITVTASVTAKGPGIRRPSGKRLRRLADDAVRPAVAAPVKDHQTCRRVKAQALFVREVVQVIPAVP